MLSSWIEVLYPESDAYLKNVLKSDVSYPLLPATSMSMFLDAASFDQPLVD
jgi:hypothetical protein